MWTSGSRRCHEPPRRRRAPRDPGAALHRAARRGRVRRCPPLRAARSHRRRQGPHGRPVAQLAAGLRGRGQPDGAAVQPPVHRQHLPRGRGPRRPLVPGDGGVPAPDPGRPDQAADLPGAQGARDHDPDRRSGGVGPPDGRPAPRHQARQHPLHRVRTRGPDRLRHLRVHPGRPAGCRGGGVAGLGPARAGHQGPAHGTRQRRLLAGGHVLGDARWPQPDGRPRGRQLEPGADGPRAQRAGAAAATRGRARVARTRAAHGDGQADRPALPLGPRARPRPAGDPGLAAPSRDADRGGRGRARRGVRRRDGRRGRRLDADLDLQGDRPRRTVGTAGPAADCPATTRGLLRRSDAGAPTGRRRPAGLHRTGDPGTGPRRHGDRPAAGCHRHPLRRPRPRGPGGGGRRRATGLTVHDARRRSRSGRPGGRPGGLAGPGRRHRRHDPGHRGRCREPACGRDRLDRADPAARAAHAAGQAHRGQLAEPRPAGRRLVPLPGGRPVARAPVRRPGRGGPVTVPAQPGRTCVEVVLRRSNGQASDGTTECTR